MRIKNILKLVVVSLFIFGMITVQPGISGGSQSTDKPLVPYVDFQTSSVVYDGKADETGFNSVTITLKNSNVITVNWRHNGNDLHVVMSADTTGYVAIGWHNSAKSGSGGTLMDGANIIIGTYSTKAVVEDDIGANSFHEKDGTDDIIGSNATEVSGTTSVEFTFPLASSDTSEDVSLKVKSFGYFIFSVGTDDDITAMHADGANGAYYMPNVYIQSVDGEAYKAPASGSFADPIFILGALAIGAVYYKKRK